MKAVNMVCRERKSRAWTQEYLSTVSGVSLRTIQRIEAGAEPSFETALALASCFNIDVNELFDLREQQIPKNAIISAALASLFIFPPLYFALSAILKYRFGVDMFYRVFTQIQLHEQGAVLFNRFSPIVFMGCLFLALCFSIHAGVMIRRPRKVGSSYIAVASLYLNRSLPMLIPLLLCILTATIFFLYALAES